MRFQNSIYFYFLLVLPALWFIDFYVGRLRAEKLKKAFNQKLLPFLTSSFSKEKARYSLYFNLSAIFLIVLALARPQAGSSLQKAKSEGLEMVIIVDISPGMTCEDVKPSRLELIKVGLKNILRNHSGSKIGIVGLSGTAMLMSPLTTDMTILDSYIDAMSPSWISNQGTSFKSAIDVARNALSRGGTADDDDASNPGTTRVILLASDGEDHEEGAIDSVKELSNENIRLFSLMVGTEAGGPIPIKSDSGEVIGYKRDKKNQVIITKARHDFLIELANAGNGAAYYFDFSNDGAQKLSDDLARLKKAEFDAQVFTSYGERFQVPLFLALVLALLEMFLGKRAPIGRIWRGRFEKSLN
jgi:Ca-activated chloride channel family protein